jgi:predicted DsbA family dithiol-disulfide isomerase
MHTEQEKIRVIYFTDPICSACWTVEPQLRKLLVEYGENIALEYHMGGLLPSWDMFTSGPITKPADVAHHWDEMGAHSDMPIDGEVWRADPLPSSYPPCRGYKAAELQGQENASRFLRRIREMVMVENKNIARLEHLQQAAVDSGLDPARLVDDYNSRSQQLFQKDLELRAQYGVRGFPAVFFVDGASNQILVYGSRPYENYEAAIKQLAPSAEKKRTPAGGDLFDRYPTLTTKEYSVITGVSMQQSEDVLTALEQKGAIQKQPVKNGVLWRRGPTFATQQTFPAGVKHG